MREPAVAAAARRPRAVVHLDDDRSRPRRLPATPAVAEACSLARSAGSTPPTSAALARRLRAREKAQSRPRTGRRGRRASWCARRSSTPASSTASTAARGTPRAARSRSCSSGARGGARRRRHRRGRALGALVRHRLARAAAPLGRARRVARPRGSPTATSTRSCALFEAAARRPRSSAATQSLREFLDDPGRPADPGRHPGRAGRPRRRRPAADRPPRQGPGVAARRRRPRRRRRRWPDLRRRHTLLQADRIGARRACSPPVTARALLTEERRLFYVACTRARERLVVTAVASPDDDGEQPSRFLDELGVDRRRHRSSAARPGRCRCPAWSAELRRTARRPRGRPRASATRPRAASPAGPAGSATSTGAPLVPQRRPRDLVGHPRALSRRRSRSAPADQPVAVSASMLAGLIECPAQWFLEREAGGAAQAHQSARASASSCTPSPTGSRRASSRTRRRRPPDGARRRGVGPARLPHPVVGRPRARASSRPRSSRFLALARRRPRRTLARPPRPRFEAVVDAARRRSRSRSSGTPTGSSSTPTAGSSWSTSRPASTRRATRPVASQPPARPLPARRRRRRASTSPRRPSAHGPAEPSWSAAGCRRRRSRCRRSSRSRPATTGRPRCCASQLMARRRAAARRGVPGGGPASTATRCAFVPICPTQSAGLGASSVTVARRSRTPGRPAAR